MEGDYMDNAYTGKRIDEAILSVLDVNAAGKVVTAEKWKELWGLVITNFNAMHDYCISIEQIRINWEESVADLEKTKEEFITKYNAFKTGLVHYGDQEPTNAETLFWIKPVKDVNPNAFTTNAEVDEIVAKATINKVDKFTILTDETHCKLYKEALTDEEQYVLEQYRTDRVINKLKFITPAAYTVTLDLPCSIPANTNVTFVYTRGITYPDGPIFSATYRAKLYILIDSVWVLKETDSVTACNGYYVVEYPVNTFASNGNINIDDLSVKGTFYKAADVTIARKATITLAASRWSNTHPYKQQLSVSDVTANSRIDLTPTPQQLAEFYTKGYTFIIENKNKVITAYCIGQKPTADYTMSATITEVNT
jgi:hypothetical protein